MAPTCPNMLSQREARRVSWVVKNRLRLKNRGTSILQSFARLYACRAHEESKNVEPWDDFKSMKKRVSNQNNSLKAIRVTCFPNFGMASKERGLHNTLSMFFELRGVLRPASSKRPRTAPDFICCWFFEKCWPPLLLIVDGFSITFTALDL